MVSPGSCRATLDALAIPRIGLVLCGGSSWRLSFGVCHKLLIPLSLLWSNWLDCLVWKVVAAPLRAFLYSSFLLLIALLIATVPTLHNVKGCPSPLPKFLQGILRRQQTEELILNSSLLGSQPMRTWETCSELEAHLALAWLVSGVCTSPGCSSGMDMYFKQVLGAQHLTNPALLRTGTPMCKS